MTKKYEMYGDANYRGLRRIRALRAFGTVCENEIGGWIQHEHNLSHTGLAWVSDDAEVSAEARVTGDARVCDHAQVSEDATVYYKACVRGRARIGGRAVVRDQATVEGDACVYGSAEVFNNACVLGTVSIYDQAKVGENAVVQGSAGVCQSAYVFGHARVEGTAYLHANVRVGGNMHVQVPFPICVRSDGHAFFIAPDDAGVLHVAAGCRYFALPEAYEHWQRTRGGTLLGEETFEILQFLQRSAARILAAHAAGGRWTTL